MRADRSLTVPWRIQEEEGRWCVWSGGCLTIQVPSDQAPTPLPSEDRITDACKNITRPHCSVWKSVHPYLPGAKANCLLILAPLFYVNAKSIIAFILFSGHNHTKRKWARKIAFLKKMQVSKIIYSIQVSCLLNTTLPEVWGNGSFPVIVMLINEAWNDLKTLIRVCGSFPRTTLVVTTKSFSSPSAQG